VGVSGHVWSLAEMVGLLKTSGLAQSRSARGHLRCAPWRDRAL